MWVFYLNDGMINFDKKKVFGTDLFVIFFSLYFFSGDEIFR